MQNQRDWGFGESPEPISAPRVVSEATAGCPACGCKTMYVIEVDLPDNPLLAGTGKVTGVYVGCPACPFASPMVSRRSALT